MIVIPMAGLSRRFTEAGFDKPKYMLAVDGKTLFAHAVESFSRYFESEKFLFIARDVAGTETFIREEVAKLGIADFQIAILEAPTGGQGETVLRGLEQLQGGNDEGITVFNIDTFRPGFRYPESFELREVDGYLETFVGSGANWSNVVPVEGTMDRVSAALEKQEASEFCCTGLYYWGSLRRFMEIAADAVARQRAGIDGAETYIAPMYNRLIEDGGDVRYSVVPSKDVIFCGTPEEFYEFESGAN